MSESAATAQQTIPLVNEEAVEAPSCGAGSRALREQAAEQANQETLAQYAKDYPVGPHDQPQSMCPAFGSLRVGLRMRHPRTCGARCWHGAARPPGNRCALAAFEPRWHESLDQAMGKEVDQSGAATQPLALPDGCVSHSVGP